MLLKNNTLVKRDEMITYKITPDFGVSNSKNEIITSAITNIYKSPSSRLSLTNLNYTKPSRVYFNIVLEDKNANFYLSVPSKYEDLFQGKMSSCWKKSGIDVVEDTSFLKLPFKSTVGGELILKDYNFKTIATSLSDSSHLNSIFQLMKSMGDGDKVVINIAIEPMTRVNWNNIAQEEIKNERNGKPRLDIDSIQEYLLKKGFEGMNTALDLYIEYRLLPVEAILGLLGGDDKVMDLEKSKAKKSSNEERNMGRPNVSALKRNSDVAKCRITILSSSTDLSRANINLLSVAESYKELNDENEFVLKPLSAKRTPNRIREIRYFDVSPNNSCILSTKELAKLIQLPPKQAQRDFKIKAIDELENDIPREITNSNGIPFAYTKQRGRELQTYRSMDKSLASLPIILTGAQGSGKTSFMKLITYENYKKGISNLVIDILEDCKIAKFCRENIPQKDRIDIDISLENTRNIPSLSFNEVSSLITEDMDSFKRISLASNIAEQVEIIVDSIADNTNGKLTDAMVRYLYSASMVTFIRPQATLNDVFDVLRYPNKRDKAIAYAKASGCFDDDMSIIENLYHLDKVVERTEIVGTDDKGKPIKEKTTEIVNNDTLITGINNRVTQLEKNPYIKKMLKQKPNPNENFIKYIEEGKTIVLSMVQYEFPSEKMRDLIATFYTCRLWLAAQVRKDNENANVCTIVLDEVYTIKGTMELMKNYLTQWRRHRISLLSSCHHLSQFSSSVWQTIKSCGTSYVLLQGTEKEQAELLKEEMLPFGVEDLLNLKRYHGIFIQKYENGYAKYIGKVPNLDNIIKQNKS